MDAELLYWSWKVPSKSYRGLPNTETVTTGIDNLKEEETGQHVKRRSEVTQGRDPVEKKIHKSVSGLSTVKCHGDHVTTKPDLRQGLSVTIENQVSLTNSSWYKTRKFCKKRFLFLFVSFMCSFVFGGK